MVKIHVTIYLIIYFYHACCIVLQKWILQCIELLIYYNIVASPTPHLHYSGLSQLMDSSNQGCRTVSIVVNATAQPKLKQAWVNKHKIYIRSIYYSGSNTEVEVIESNKVSIKTKQAVRKYNDRAFAGKYFLARNYQCINRVYKLESTKACVF